MDVNILKLSSSAFPHQLKEIAGTPKELYWAGVDPSDWLNKPKVGMVGSRKITPYGRTVTSKLAGDLAKSGVVIISGLAYGVDITAHQAALGANGVTVAVLGTSLEQIYPASHAHVAAQMCLRGTIFSEYSKGSISFQSNFVARNRIISGLSDVLVITEAAINSGSLHTARFALEQGKTVMAVPGNITSPISEGCNNLIKSGAMPVTSADDVLFALGIKSSVNKIRVFRGSPAEQLVLRFIEEGVSAQDDLAAAARLDSPVLSSTLTMLEIEGYIRPAGGGNWVIA